MLKGRLKSLVLSAPLLALAMAAAPAHADPTTLSCTSTKGPSYTLRINYVTGLIEELGDNGGVIVSAPADISANKIVWGERAQSNWRGFIDRLAGTGMIYEYRDNIIFNHRITCRLGTPVF